MDQKKIGEFLKNLRLSKHLTQEELAEHFYVSSRTISRWETGVNLPDICLLIELADFYNVDVREIMEGEHNKMNDNEKDLAVKVATYVTDKNEKSYKNIIIASGIGLICFIAFFILNIIFQSDSFLLDFINGLTLSIGIGSLIYILLYSCNVIQKINKNKKLKILLKVLCIVVIIVCLTFIFATYAWFTEA